MGCCMSSTTASRPHYSPPKQEPKRSNNATIAPPPASLEEETVKEVLSETPIIPKPPQNPPLTQQKITQVQQNPPPTQQKITQIPIAQQPKTEAQLFTREEEAGGERTPEISQASEMYSVVDTHSTATTATTTTTTVTEIRDDEVTSKKRINRSPAKVPRKRPYTGDRDRVPKPPAIRERPAMKRGSPGHSRTPQQRNVGSSRVERDLGERSGRRSRSPATRMTAGGAVKGRSGGIPTKVIGKSGSKPAEVAVESGVKKEEESKNDNALMERSGKESIDNPQVSLECFIFL